MVREGTRSQTGNSRPRIFTVPDTAPAQKRRGSKTKVIAPAAAAAAAAAASASASAPASTAAVSEAKRKKTGAGVSKKKGSKANRAGAAAVGKKTAGAVKTAAKETEADNEPETEAK